MAAKVTEYHPEDTSVQYGKAISHFREISPGDEKNLKWYSNIQRKLNDGFGKIELVNNLVWNYRNKMYVFVSYFEIKPQKANEQASQKHEG